MTKIIILGDTYSSLHKTGFNHPENPKRISALATAMQKRLIPVISADRTREVKPEIIHTMRYLDSLRESIARVPQNDQYENSHYLVALDEDTYASAESLNVALAGLALQEQAIDMLLADPNHAKPVPFIITRPPGHHARPDASMGFCLFNNAAYAARYSQRKYGLSKVAIFDWDVHHGNGTEEIFYEDHSVYCASIHAYPYWPEGYGEPEKRGGGFNLNLPMPIEAGDLQYSQYIDRYVIPQLERFEPELIIVAAGFDAHRLERNSGLQFQSLMAVTENGFSYMTDRLVKFAERTCQSKILFTLEGGYYLPSLTSGFESVLDTISAGKALRYPGYSEGASMAADVYQSYCNRIEAALL
jgi:acetoin utilization deacetylase AcuC-like enzyme